MPLAREEFAALVEVRWLEGEPIHRDRVLSPERRRTHLMACVAQCASERLVVEA